MYDCIFCKIVNKELPSYKVYEDDLVLAFLDINPLTVGHTLVIPKEHSENLLNMDDKFNERVLRVCKKNFECFKENKFKHLWWNKYLLFLRGWCRARGFPHPFPCNPKI